TLDNLQNVVKQLQGEASSASTHPSNSVWAPAACEEWSNTWQSGIETSLEQLRNSCCELKQAAQNLAPILGMGEGNWRERDLRALNTLSKILIESPTTPVGMMTATDWDNVSASVTEWITHGIRRDNLRSQLYSIYSNKVLQLDLDGLIKRLLESNEAWFLPRMLGRRSVKRALKRVMQPGQKIDPSAMLHDLKTACTLRDEENCLSKASDRARELLGSFWHEGEADWSAVEQMRGTASTMRTLAAHIAGTDIERASSLRQQWATLLRESHEQLSEGGPTWQLLRGYIDKDQAFYNARSALESTLALDSQAAWGNDLNDDHLGTIIYHLDKWDKHLNDLREWCHWRIIRRQAVELGLQQLIDGYEKGGLPASQIVNAFQRSFYMWWVNKITDDEPTLRTFFSSEFERKIDEFREVDKRYTELTRTEIQARLAAKLPHGGETANKNSEMGILMRERQKQRRQMPIRQLFQKISNLLPRLKPCLLMSPISVAQYLDPAHPPFDLVVFDEASQIPVWDAVGAIARGKEAVIVGDPKQLPPTNFFSRSEDPDALEDDIVEDLESILDDCLAAQLPTMYLRWHYRSRHESLIAFSNFHYYENKLLTFPSPSIQRSVSLRPVKGVYDKSKSRTNRAEAEAVVIEVLRRLLDPSLNRYSIGIVTFSMSQQTLVEDLLDDARRKNPKIDTFFDNNLAPNNEPVFVKNIENVQGDERDAILFSICYGPDALGRVSMNFGPMNRDGGERRLNVAITRARREVVVFSTLRADQIDLSKTRAKGVADLKSFLDYATRGPVALTEQLTTNPDAECESIFEEQVCDALRNKGFTIHSQVGCSGYRIDLAVVDTESPGRYLLGIECDGANYHRAKTARDRDRLRENVLKGLGWQLHRIWSTDWWEKPDKEIARIENAIEEAKKAPKQIIEQVQVAPPPTPISWAPMPLKREQNQPDIPGLMSLNSQCYEPYDTSLVQGDLTTFYFPGTDWAIRQAIEDVVKREGPVQLDLAAKRVAALWGISKLGSKVLERITQLALHTSAFRTQSQKRVFLWPSELTPTDYKMFRIPGNDDISRRNADELPPEEVANAALY
ncbi:MAG: DUF3320 domain-containing protein, partial [bacterium]